MDPRLREDDELFQYGLTSFVWLVLYKQWVEMQMKISVVIPVYNGESTLTDCLRALKMQSMPAELFEVIVVNDGSTDKSSDIASTFNVRIIETKNNGAPAGRNKGILAAKGKWVAFTDCDCIPSRMWLTRLLASVESNKTEPIGAAGKTLGFNSKSNAARFVDLVGGLDAEKYLQHPLFPFAPSCNLMYRRDILNEVGGFDERYASYDACDLHTRILRQYSGQFSYVEHAVVLHKHRGSWKDFWHQQRNYGRGLAQFMLNYKETVNWPIKKEFNAWLNISAQGFSACSPGSDDNAIVRRGEFVKAISQRLGFVSTYWNPIERHRW